MAELYPTLSLGTSDWTLLAIAPVIGSFVGVVIRRLPESQGIIWARSRCEHCKTVLAPRDLIPLASWLIGGARCRYCDHRLSGFYPGIELSALAVTALSVAIDRSGMAWLDASLGCWLLALSWIDLRQWLLPDALTLPLVALGIAAAWLFAPGELADRVVGASCGYVGLRAVAWIYRRARGRDGLGRGDAKLLAAAGAWVGASGLPSVLAAAAVAALVVAVGIVLAGTRLNRHSALPFGPFLATATWLVWVFGPIVF